MMGRVWSTQYGKHCKKIRKKEFFKIHIHIYIFFIYRHNQVAIFWLSASFSNSGIQTDQ